MSAAQKSRLAALEESSRGGSIWLHCPKDEDTAEDRRAVWETVKRERLRLRVVVWPEMNAGAVAAFHAQRPEGLTWLGE